MSIPGTKDGEHPHELLSHRPTLPASLVTRWQGIRAQTRAPPSGHNKHGGRYERSYWNARLGVMNILLRILFMTSVRTETALNAFYTGH